MKQKITAWMGVDPGKTGAYALLSEYGELSIHPWPKSDNHHKVYIHLRKIIRMHDIKFCVIEKVASVSGQGVTSVFTFGKNYGAWKMLLAALNIKHLKMTPTAWQKGIITKTDGPDPKSRVKNVATELFGRTHFFGPRGGYKDGYGDAALMAYRAKLMDTGGM